MMNLSCKENFHKKNEKFNFFQFLSADAEKL